MANLTTEATERKLEAEHEVAAKLVAVARAAWHALDNSESRTEDGEEVVVLHDPWAEELNIALTALDMLPDNPDPYILEEGPAKAERLLSTALSAARREAEEARERALDVACEIAERIRREKREDPSEWQAGRLRGALDVADALAAYREAGEGRDG